MPGEEPFGRRLECAEPLEIGDVPGAAREVAAACHRRIEARMVGRGSVLEPGMQVIEHDGLVFNKRTREPGGARTSGRSCRKTAPLARREGPHRRDILRDHVQT